MAKKRGRRQFLKESAALTGLAVGAIQVAKSEAPAPEVTPGQRPPADTPESIPYGVRSQFETTSRTSGDVHRTPLQDTPGIITPSPLHFQVNHRAITPNIDPRQHRLMVHGLVNRPLIFTMDELKRLPAVTRVHFLACAGNSYLNLERRKTYETVQQTHGATSCSEWTGVPLSVLLRDVVGLKPEAKWIVAEGGEAKKHTASIPLEKALDDVLIAYSQNGEAVRPEQGYPLKLIVPGFEGVRNVKWLRRIKVVDKPYMTKWETTTYGNLKRDGKTRWFQMELEPNSVITFPSGGQKLPGRGFYEITGLAWSGGGAVRKVEVSTDGGKTWKDAQLQEPIYRRAHTRFRMPWTWNGEETVLQSRCTDERGDVQPSLVELSQIWNVSVEYWLSTMNRIQHFNAIQRWKVTPEGSVRNAIWTV